MKNMEQYSRKNNIEIPGIPHFNNEDVSVIVEYIGKVIGISVRQEETVVHTGHIIPGWKGRPLIVQSSTRMA